MRYADSVLLIVALLAFAADAGTKGASVDVRVGRQLFVDDYVIESTNGVVRHWNRPVKELDPVLWPGDGAGRGVRDGGRDANLTCATDGGLWWDPTRGVYRLWYQADWLGDICYAESGDGRKWTYPDLGVVKGTNRVFANDVIDSWCVIPDYAAANPYAAWKMHISEPGGLTADGVWTSADGCRFEPLGKFGVSGDRSTMYYDPFRTNWVFSLRAWQNGRARRRHAVRTLDAGSGRWRWPGEKDADPALPEAEPWLVATNRPNWQLYSFDAVAYESLMLGVMEVLYNTPGDNADCEKVGLPKQTALHFCFSRDGRTYVPRDEPDIAPSGWGSGAWDTGYLSAIAGICTVDDERLVFHYSGLRGDGTRLVRGKAVEDWSRNGMYANGAIGRATLRRDGFAGMVADAAGELVTKPLAFTGGHLFVNAECRFGELKAEVIGADGCVLPGFSSADCRAIARRDARKAELVFRGGSLAALGAQGVRIRFRLRCATLYSFWLTSDPAGSSGGYVAAGGPSYPGLRDCAGGYDAPVRPIGVNGQEPWNVRAHWFMYAPTFGFTNRADAAGYRFTVGDETGERHVFEEASATAPLTPVWNALPASGWVSVTCEALGADGGVLGLAGRRDFWKQAPYRPGAYPKPRADARETARRIERYVMRLPIVQAAYLGEGPVPTGLVTRASQVFVAYPSKMGASVMRAMVRLARQDRDLRAEALALAEGVKRKLLSVTEPDGAPLGGFPRTYESHPALSGHPAKMVGLHAGKVMTCYPAEVGDAYLDLYGLTHDETARAAALRIADRYLALQGEDGTWPLNCRIADAKAVEGNRLVPVGVMAFLERVFALTGEAKYRAAADRAFASIEKGPLATWNWEGQFEDVKPTAPFQNLTKHGACSTAMYLLKRFPGDARRLAQVREILRFAEDQFICWERPCRGVSDDPRGNGALWDCASWRCPAVLEQYRCYVPIDASSAKLVNTFLALYRAEGNPLDLAKAKTLGDAIMRETRDDGYLPTFWFDLREDWPNCMLASAAALENLADSTSADDPGI